MLIELKPFITQRMQTGEAMKPPLVVTEEKLSRLWPLPRSTEQREGPPFHLRKPMLPVMICVATGSGKVIFKY